MEKRGEIERSCASWQKKLEAGSSADDFPLMDMSGYLISVIIVASSLLGMTFEDRLLAIGNSAHTLKLII